MLSKYAPLADFLRSQTESVVRLKFTEVEKILGFTLPHSARRHPAWWRNSHSGGSHQWAALWGDAGWKKTGLDREQEIITFSRLSEGDSAIDDSPHYWWVNHKQTYQSEVDGGYIWSPKVNQNGARNQTYDNLTLVLPGDVVVSYAGTLIKSIGVVTGSHIEASKPEEFGQTGENWSSTGWLVPIEWTSLEVHISPKAHIADIAPLLPEKNSPIQANGNGNQSCYLASIAPELGELILDLAQVHDADAVQAIVDLQVQTEADEQQRAIEAANISPTEKEQLIRSRIGQGLFRQRVLALEPRCRLTGVEDQSFLIASHIKPWKNCDNAERLDGHNGLMLAPHVDKLFDRGWISFGSNGELLVADRACAVLRAWGLSQKLSAGKFNTKQRSYLAYHREVVFQS